MAQRVECRRQMQWFHAPALKRAKISGESKRKGKEFKPAGKYVRSVYNGSHTGQRGEGEGNSRKTERGAVNH